MNAGVLSPVDVREFIVRFGRPLLSERRPVGGFISLRSGRDNYVRQIQTKIVDGQSLIYYPLLAP